MQSLKRKVVLAFCLLLIGNFAFSDDFNEKQKAIIYNEAIKILRNYQQYANQMADEVVDLTELNKTSQKLIDLFVSRKAIVYNDLDPSHKLSEVYELETYITNLLLWYPDGMKIYLDFDNLKAGNIISHGNDIYTVDIMTSKRIDGNYLNQQKNSSTEQLLYRIAFFKKNSSFENYKIAGVRSDKTIKIADDSKVLAEVKSISFSEKEMQLIKDQTKSLLNDYINFLNLMTDPKESHEDKFYYNISFMGLFKDSTLNVANDIEPDPQKRWLSIADYRKNLIATYPEGIRNLALNIDSAEYGKVIPEGNEKYYINGYIDKFFSGKYMSKTVFRDNSKFDFKVSFERDENTFKNFKLASIDKFGVNLYSQAENTANQELPNKSIGTLKRNGLYFGFSFGGGVVNYKDPNLTDSKVLSWSVKGKSSLNFQVNTTWYFLSRLGVSMGVGYDKYSASTNLTGDFRNTSYSVDINNDSYLKNVTSNYDSLLTFSYLTVPITLIYHSNSNPEKWGIYAETGVVASFNLSSKYHTTGSFQTSGYYEQHPVQIINVPDLGFVNRTNIDSKGNSNASDFNLSLKAAIGVSYPIGYFTTIYAGPEVVWSMNNISKAKQSTDAFGNITSAKNVSDLKYGIKFGVSYKF